MRICKATKFRVRLTLLFILTAALSVFAETPTFVISQPALQSGDEWFARDKLYHFTVSAGLAFGSFYIYRETLHNNREGSYCFSGGFTISVGAVKEYYDSKHPDKHQASWKDFIADLAGTGLGLCLAYFAFN